MKKLILFFVLAIAFTGFGQVKSTDKATIQFYSSIGGINAKNELVKGTLNTATGALSFTAKIENFIFANSLMQKHYNEEDMMHSSKFPTAVFKGTIINNKTVNYTKNGMYAVSVKGKLTIKGVSQNIGLDGKIKIAEKRIITTAEFKIDRHLYNVIGNEESVSQIIKLVVNATFNS